jgi:hypothetical protein
VPLSLGAKEFFDRTARLRGGQLPGEISDRIEIAARRFLIAKLSLDSIPLTLVGIPEIPCGLVV